jgi:hypothetical protein
MKLTPGTRPTTSWFSNLANTNIESMPTRVTKMCLPVELKGNKISQEVVADIYQTKIAKWQVRSIAFLLRIDLNKTLIPGNASF